MAASVTKLLLVREFSKIIITLIISRLFDQKKSDTSPRIYPWNKKNVSLFSSPSIHRWGNNSKFFMSYSKFALTLPTHRMRGILGSTKFLKTKRNQVHWFDSLTGTHKNFFRRKKFLWEPFTEYSYQLVDVSSYGN